MPIKWRIANDPEGAKALVLIAFTTLTLNPQLEAAKPEAETLWACAEYVRIREGQIDRELESETSFFAHDSHQAETTTPSSGEARVAEMHTKDLNGHIISVSGGAIHHWRAMSLFRIRT